MSEATLRLVDIKGNALPSPDLVNNEVIFKDGFTWTWCLDARHEPYNELDEAEVLQRAASVRKRYVLFGAEAADEA